MKNFTEYRKDFQESFRHSISETNKINFDNYVSEWLKSISKKSISDLNESEFIEFKQLTTDWNNKKIRNFKPDVIEKLKLNENQISLIKNIFKISEFENAKNKLLNIDNLSIESITESDDLICISMKKFQPLTFQKIGRDRDSVEQQVRLEFQNKLQNNFNEEDFLVVFNSMFESYSDNLSELYAEVDKLLA